MKSPILLPQDQFRERTLARDKHKCVVCGSPVNEVHHLLESRLFDCGGHYLDNGAALCQDHRLASDTTEISVEALRKHAKIVRVVIPGHFYNDERYDRWGNQVLPNGTRLRGELFQDESVQKVLSLGDALRLFSWWVKYPRTMHLPWSQGITSDDRILLSLAHFLGLEVVVTEKFDGENTTIYADYLHARSLDGVSHPSRDWVKNFSSKFAYSLPEGWRLCGENLFARHSIGYDNLDSYFYGFSLWDDTNTCLGWDETLEYFEILGVKPVREIWRGVFDEKAIKALYDPEKDWGRCEGYVVRLAGSFHYRDFRKAVAKFVRQGHVQTDDHWMKGQITPNLLA